MHTARPARDVARGHPTSWQYADGSTLHASSTCLRNAALARTGLEVCAAASSAVYTRRALTVPTALNSAVRLSTVCSFGRFSATTVRSYHHPYTVRTTVCPVAVRVCTLCIVRVCVHLPQKTLSGDGVSTPHHLASQAAHGETPTLDPQALPARPVNPSRGVGLRVAPACRPRSPPAQSTPEPGNPGLSSRRNSTCVTPCSRAARRNNPVFSMPGNASMHRTDEFEPTYQLSGNPQHLRYLVHCHLQRLDLLEGANDVDTHW